LVTGGFGYNPRRNRSALLSSRSLMSLVISIDNFADKVDLNCLQVEADPFDGTARVWQVADV
jgi:hypothetical protein